ncbi:hypothetical protein J3F84DRAFT_355456 [Trichoderma pleuroticola]
MHLYISRDLYQWASIFVSTIQAAIWLFLVPAGACPRSEGNSREKRKSSLYQQHEKVRTYEDLLAYVNETNARCREGILQLLRDLSSFSKMLKISLPSLGLVMVELFTS